MPTPQAKASELKMERTWIPEELQSQRNKKSNAANPKTPPMIMLNTAEKRKKRKNRAESGESAETSKDLQTTQQGKERRCCQKTLEDAETEWEA